LLELQFTGRFILKRNEASANDRNQRITSEQFAVMLRFSRASQVSDFEMVIPLTGAYGLQVAGVKKDFMPQRLAPRA
jgi:hypothetical protein